MDQPDIVKEKVLKEFINLLTYYIRKIRFARKREVATLTVLNWLESTRNELQLKADIDVGLSLQHLLSRLEVLESDGAFNIHSDVIEELALFQFRHGLEKKQ